MKPAYLILAVVAMFTVASASFAQEESPMPVTLTYAEGDCEAHIPIGAPYSISTQEASTATLNGGIYPVTEASALGSDFWVAVRAAEADDSNSVWVNASDYQLTVTTNCLFNSGFGAQEPTEANAPTTLIKYPYGGCLLQSTVGTPTHPTVQEASDRVTDATQLIVFNVSVDDDTPWIGVYGGTLGLPVYITPDEFVEGNSTALTASCLYIPMVASAI